MVVKLIQSENLEDLEHKINHFISFKDNERCREDRKIDHTPYSFKVDVKVVPGYTYIDPDPIQQANFHVHMESYFIAVIQY